MHLRPGVQADHWSTLGTLIDMGKWLISFMNNDVDASAASYIIDEFSNNWELTRDAIDTTFLCIPNSAAGTAGAGWACRPLLGDLCDDCRRALPCS
ncbi:hypothetical protein FRC08_016237 [Ceratobasidium sp. 394]|nr:hypothetical protein FRC08_016237 [Ceratobasidium sp. 394]KAG9095927.1 hypothetical protein FS749_009455 [Ceratobasidium sp. UAMH 11750]